VGCVGGKGYGSYGVTGGYGVGAGEWLQVTGMAAGEETVA
jgi:hypothetical protein